MKREDVPAQPGLEPLRCVGMSALHLDAVMPIERRAYAVPWTRGNFVDSLAAGCLATCLVDRDEQLLAYSLAMRGAGEMHLLNLTVAPEVQRRGHARRLLERLALAAADAGLDQIWLEVRASNGRAREVYRRFGFVEVGLRTGYYPVAAPGGHGVREDAIAMTLAVDRGNR